MCVDVDAAKVDRINAGGSPIHEPGLDELIATHRRVAAPRDGRRASGGRGVRPYARRGGDAIVHGRHRPHRRRFGRTRRSARPSRRRASYHVVVVKSTVVPGTTDGIVYRGPGGDVGASRAGDDFGVGMNPEFLTEGQAVVGLHVAGQPRARRESTIGRTRFSRELYALVRPRRAAAAHEHADGRDDQVRLERAARDDDLLRQRDRRSLATRSAMSTSSTSCGACTHRDYLSPIGARRRASCGADHVVPRGGVRLRRKLPPQGRAGADRARDERRGRPMRVLRAVLETNEGQPDELVRLRRACTRRPPRRARPRCSASRSSPTRTTCASRRRSRSCERLVAQARTSRSTTRS